MAEFTNLVDSTPALRAYAERMWTRHTDGLSAAIADETGVDHDNLTCVVLARFVLEIPVLARGRQDRRAAVEASFDILTRGWESPSKPSAPRSAWPADVRVRSFRSLSDVQVGDAGG
ncbi:hypothetical protein [Actinomadura sp. DC4]|uniref:hypothetical protein n=1 Tax=Actinomadura sp. DC4 TaxID=3055069 RepID=UPI0025B0E4B7|nr:hypothetical protein [Actinomadura sp. DC4]MDN3354480.1 hypothetical protein [Actinomadura sp. DC4]